MLRVVNRSGSSWKEEECLKELEPLFGYDRKDFGGKRNCAVTAVLVGMKLKKKRKNRQTPLQSLETGIRTFKILNFLYFIILQL